MSDLGPTSKGAWVLRLPFGWRYRRHVWPLNASSRLAGEPLRYVPHFFRVGRPRKGGKKLALLLERGARLSKGASGYKPASPNPGTVSNPVDYATKENLDRIG